MLFYYGLSFQVFLFILFMWLVFISGAGSATAKDIEEDYTWPNSVVLEDGATYDYIVVGAGAAGSAAAARLALAGHSVLLVEAGPEPTPASTVPGLSMALMGSSLDWNYPTIGNNASCLASEGGACRVSAGKSLGGSTAINHMIYARGSPLDYEYSLPGWSWRELRPYFLRAEGLQETLPKTSTRHHNTTGPVKVGFFENPDNPWQTRIYRGYQELNFPANRDVNADSQIGVSRTLSYFHNGERMSTARAYLTRGDVKRRLHVATETSCTSVLLDDNNSVRGITVLHGASHRPLRLRARREVVLSAGTVRSPQLLMLSGIGPADQLRAHSIPVRADLPVGDGLQDHVLPVVVILVDRGNPLSEDINNVLEKMKQTVQFVNERTGPLAANGVTDITAFVNTQCYDSQNRKVRNESSECEIPSMQFIHVYIDRKLLALGRSLIRQTTVLNDDVIDQLVAANVDNALVVVSPVVLSPKSFGYVRLASTDPSVPPIINPNYFSDERDVEEALRGVHITRHLVETSVFREMNAKIMKLKFPKCSGRGQAYWRCYVRHMTSSVFHAAGTCALGSVVDARLRVLGVRGLRVADMSVLPRLPRGNTAAAAIALGERVADFIEEDWKK